MSKRRAVHRVGLAMTCTAIVLSLSSCATTIIPPPQLQHPITVHLLDLGRTPSLVLPGEDGTMVRYVYGDWNFYALRKNDPGHGIAALFWPTAGTLGRANIEYTTDVELMLQRFNVGASEILSFDVEHETAHQLRARLDDLFNANIDTRVYNEPYSFEFVHHPRRYTALSNSNHMTAGWLRELGCETRGWPVFSNWRLKVD